MTFRKGLKDKCTHSHYKNHVIVREKGKNQVLVLFQQKSPENVVTRFII